jgi:uncharacterized protein YrzB (UPF0473 family)
MAEENQELEQQFVEIYVENGETEKCEVYDVIDFENKTYALLLPISEEDNEDAEVIVMEYVEDDDNDGYFQTIDDEEEFKRVCDYIQSLDDEDEEE